MTASPQSHLRLTRPTCRMLNNSFRHLCRPSLFSQPSMPLYVILSCLVPEYILLLATNHIYYFLKWSSWSAHWLAKEPCKEYVFATVAGISTGHIWRTTVNTGPSRQSKYPRWRASHCNFAFLAKKKNKKRPNSVQKCGHRIPRCSETISGLLRFDLQLLQIIYYDVVERYESFSAKDTKTAVSTDIQSSTIQ